MRISLAVAVALLLAACTSREQPVTFRGPSVVPVVGKPDFTLTSTDGKPYNFAAATHGYATLLYFGYTHCADVCPIHMANIAAVLKNLSSEQRAHVRVVFVTTDPARDTPEHLRAWLDNFDPSFIGLRGTPEQVNNIESALNLPASAADIDSSSASKRADYEVGHAAQVLAFTPDDSLRVQYPFGMRREDWAYDLPRLIAFGAKR
jgi:protein SCO1/2